MTHSNQLVENFDAFRRLHQAAQQNHSLIVACAGTDRRLFTNSEWGDDDGDRSDPGVRAVRRSLVDNRLAGDGITGLRDSVSIVLFYSSATCKETHEGRVAARWIIRPDLMTASDPTQAFLERDLAVTKNHLIRTVRLHRIKLFVTLSARLVLATPAGAQTLQSRIESAIQSEIERSGVPSFQVAIGRGGQIVL